MEAIHDVLVVGAGCAGMRAAIEAHIFMPKDVPLANRVECESYGARVNLVDGLISDCARIVAERKEREHWFDVTTLKEPFRVEGKKTMALELAEAGRWGDAWCPDVMIYPTGGGTGIVGMWKAISEMAQLGWIGIRRPRFVVVQSTGCAPIVRAFEASATRADRWENASTIAAGIRVPSAIGDYLVLQAVRESDGTAVAVTDAEILEAQAELGRLTGIFAAPEGAATYAAVKHLRGNGFLRGDERVVLFNTGMGLKYVSAS